jgi:hypothetical protein
MNHEHEEKFTRVARGYAGADGQDLPQSSNRIFRAANFGTKERTCHD